MDFGRFPYGVYRKQADKYSYRILRDRRAMHTSCTNTNASQILTAFQFAWTLDLIGFYHSFIEEIIVEGS